MSRRASLSAALLALFVVSCAPSYNTKRDPALRIGPIAVGTRLRRVQHFFGNGTPAQWVDERGQHVNVLLYRSGTAVLAIAVEADRVSGFELYQRLPDGPRVHGEFSLPQAAEPVASHAGIADLPWLGEPVFSDVLPSPPPDWNVPTDFTSAQGGKAFYVVRQDHAVSKTQSKDDGWTLHLR